MELLTVFDLIVEMINNFLNLSYSSYKWWCSKNVSFTTPRRQIIICLRYSSMSSSCCFSLLAGKAALNINLPSWTRMSPEMSSRLQRILISCQKLLKSLLFSSFINNSFLGESANRLPIALSPPVCMSIESWIAEHLSLLGALDWEGGNIL